ncbi:uncharacterized protein LOC142504992 [Primulina tabacum]|uniref:uncharacterized protein LOC142504992 n=1 Tax=Primulina tabacum TaxID=48773 RepID=UPI003F59E11C
MVSITRRVCRREAASYNMIERVNAQLSNLHRIIEVGDIQCVTNLRMNQSVFVRLYYLLTNLGGLGDSRYVRVEEKVAMFLSLLAHHKKNWVAGHDYIRSGQTVSAHFHDVLKALLKLHPLLFFKPSPADEDCRNEAWRCFKGCLGTLNGTHIGVHIPCRDKARYRNRKGCYYLCDNGYANVEGFLRSHRCVRYHRDAWGNRACGPQDYKEFFNWRYSQARNVIERAFDPMDNVEEYVGSPINDTQNAYINSLESSIGWDA